MNNLLSTSPINRELPSWLISLIPVLIVIIIWSLFWKGLALWHSGRRGESIWFTVFLVFNDLGILEIIYLIFVIKLKFSELFTKQLN